MSRPINLVLFGDQTVEKLSSIQSLVRLSKSSPAARRFLREATDTLQLDFDKLSKEDQSWNHDFHTLLGLAEDNIVEKNPNGVIATVLMCIGRLGDLITYAEEDPSILGSTQDPVQVLAFCTGLLPAAVLVSARDTSELFEIGREVISITFRMAHEIIRRMKLIEDTNQSWAITMVGKSPEQVQPILDAFHAKHEIPYSKRIAIGVVSTGWLTLMGAPSSMALLMQFSKEIDEAPKIKTDTNGAVHTEYMPKFDMDLVLGSSPILDIPITSKARMVSPSSCRQYDHTTLGSLLAEIMVDIAHNILRITDTAEACISDLVGTRPVSLTVAGPTGHLSAVQKTLQNTKIEYSIREHKQLKKDAASRGGSDLIAIVGVSGRFPGSDTMDGFFEDLLQGKSQIKTVPKSRFDLDTYYDPTGKKRNTTSTQYGAFLDRPGHFDNRLFNISPREATQMDPLQRLLFTTSYEALESAGYSRNATLSTKSNRIATYFGQASEDWRDILNNEDIDIYYVPSLSRPFGPSRLSYHHKWGGGTYALDAACATSTTAIQLACSALNSRECDTALAGGGSLLVSPNTFAGLSRSGMISDDKGCKTYQDDANGYTRGEGIGVVVLKRLEDAVADNDNILGVIRGSARTYTSTSTSITHPSAESQARIYEEVLRQSSVPSNEIAYVEMHGTGTQAGDLEEMTSVLQVMGRGRSKDNVLTVGAVKANVGHGEGAAGITSLIKVLMMMRERRIPPQPGLPFKLNHNFPKLDNLHVQIAGVSGKGLTLKPSPASHDGKIRCLVNSFDASGGNTSLLVEEPPAQPAKEKNPLPCHIVTLSARSVKSLQVNRKNLLDYLTRNPHTKLADVAYTTTARRMHETLRAAYPVKTTKELITLLTQDVSKDGSKDPKTKPPPMKTVFTFTGQGSQYAGMGQQLYQNSSALREILSTYQQLAKHQGLPHFLDIISDGNIDISIKSATCVQLAVVALEVATAQLFNSWGVSPDIVIGHSLGEFSALCVAGVLSISDTLFLVGTRAQLMEKRLKAGEYSMLAIGRDVESVRVLLASDSKSSWSNTGIACINAPQITVVSGPVSEIAALKNRIEKDGSRATTLNVPFGFHSHHIEPILSSFETAASNVVFNSPKIPIASTLLGKVIAIDEETVFGPSYLARQAREHVSFVGAVEACAKYYSAKSQLHYIEIGPEPVCTGLIRRILDIPVSQLLPTMKSAEDNWATVSSSLSALYKAGANIDWPQYHREFKSCLSLLQLPTYAFDEKDFWTPFVERTNLGADQSHTTEVTTQKASDKPQPPAFSTTSLQWIEHELIEAKSISATFGSFTSEPHLYKAIQGHVVNGVTVCSLSIFCDMARSAAQYAYLKLNPGKKVPAMSIFDVDMTHALVVPQPNPEQIVRTTISYSSGEEKAHITFHSTSGRELTEHGSLRLSFGDSTAWFARQSQTGFLVNTRINSLKEGCTSGHAHRLLKPVIYRLFDNLVSYGKDYQGMEEIWVDAESRDAVGTIVLPNTAGSGTFLYNPFWIDAAIHLAGFLVNSGLKYPEDIACLSTGFESWRLTEELRADETYTTYVSMQDTETPNLLSGAAYVFDSKQKLIQVTEGIRFQKLKKVVLTTLLGPAKPSVTISKNLKSLEKPKGVPVPTITKSESLSSVRDEDTPFSTGYTTPASTSSADEDNHSLASSATSVAEYDDKNSLTTFLSIVASESGYDVEDMEPSTAFSDMGMDSLMAITILAAFQRDTGIELPATFLLTYPTVEEAKIALVGEQHEEEHTATHDHGPKPSATLVETALTPVIVSDTDTCASQEKEVASQDTIESKYETVPTLADSKPIAESKAVLLQGSPTSTGANLFLFPDGSGSPSRYISLPALGNNVKVYGLESPFLKSSADYTCSLDEICSSFIAAMKTVQAAGEGPFLLGGFSLGAVYAYEVSRRLLQDNEQVDVLFIVDMAVPKSMNIDVLPTPEELQEAGLIPTVGRQTKMQKEHIANTVRAMAKHDLTPCSPNQQPRKVVLVTSSEAGLAAGKTCKLAQWAQGTTPALQGWSQLVGQVHDVHEVKSEHFSMFRPPTVGQLGEIFGSVIAKV